jgi:hypothetical protein
LPIEIHAKLTLAATGTIIQVESGGKSQPVTLPQIGQRNANHNPAGTDNLLHVKGPCRITASLQVENLANKELLYNFLSMFGERISWSRGP